MKYVSYFQSKVALYCDKNIHVVYLHLNLTPFIVMEYTGESLKNT